jgi:hypothetical protein
LVSTSRFFLSLTIHELADLGKHYKKGGLGRMKRLLFLGLICFLLSGCTQDKPKPEGSVEIIPLQVSNMKNSAVEVVSQQQNATLTIKHHVRNQNVYVECFIPHFTFKDKGGKRVTGEGHIVLYVDGKKVEDMNTAAFIVKGLDKGVHDMKVEVFHNDSTSYNLKKSWQINIQ